MRRRGKERQTLRSVGELSRYWRSGNSAREEQKQNWCFRKGYKGCDVYAHGPVKRNHGAQHDRSTAGISKKK